MWSWLTSDLRNRPMIRLKINSFERKRSKESKKLKVRDRVRNIGEVNFAYNNRNYLNSG